MWGLNLVRPFETLKHTLDSTPLLRWMNAQRPFQVYIDWNILEIGAVLTQKDDDIKEYIIVYASQSNNDT